MLMLKKINSMKLSLLGLIIYSRFIIFLLYSIMSLGDYNIVGQMPGEFAYIADTQDSRECQLAKAVCVAIYNQSLSIDFDMRLELRHVAFKNVVEKCVVRRP